MIFKNILKGLLHGAATAAFVALSCRAIDELLFRQAAQSASRNLIMPLE
jgi:hypothetical protein